MENKDSKEKLLIACKKVLLEEGQAAFTVRRVAKAAGVNQGLVHHYFGSKENMVNELLDFVATQVLDQVKTYLKKSGSQNLPIEFLTTTDLGKFMIEIIYLSQHMPGVRERILKIISERRNYFGKLFGINNPNDRILMQVCILGSVLLSCIDPDIKAPEVLQHVQKMVLKAAQQS